MKQFWVIFLKDPAFGTIHGTAYGHNATGDYKTNPYYVGTAEMKVCTTTMKTAEAVYRSALNEVVACTEEHGDAQAAHDIAWAALQEGKA